MRYECLILFPQLMGETARLNHLPQGCASIRQTGVSVNPKTSLNLMGKPNYSQTIYPPGCVSIHGVGKQAVSGNPLPQFDGEDALS